MVLIRDAHHAMHAALKGNWRVSHARRPYKARGGLDDLVLFKLIAPGLEGGPVHGFAEVVADHVPDKLVGLGDVADGVALAVLVDGLVGDEAVGC